MRNVAVSIQICESTNNYMHLVNCTSFKINHFSVFMPIQHFHIFVIFAVTETDFFISMSNDESEGNVEALPNIEQMINIESCSFVITRQLPDDGIFS